jgi:ATP-dependent DNA ligase
MSLEGIVYKRLDVVCQSGRSRSWIKVKGHQESEFIIVGTWFPASPAAWPLHVAEPEG